MCEGIVSLFTDRRQARRYRLTLPVELEHGQGITRDISTAGMFYEGTHLLAPGEPIKLTLVLQYAEASGPVHVQCRGHVVRVERREGSVGVAVAFTAYRFLTQGQC